MGRGLCALDCFRHQAVIANKEQALLSKELALLRLDLPHYMVPFSTSDLVFRKPGVGASYMLYCLESSLNYTKTREILKPDIAALGLNILAACSPAVGKLNFNILSGTSMACPHVTGSTFPHNF
ncbi:hypothetical protein L1987_54921 [Smallanthus sonchifolius]|uniref:Uncharacterized protein n=1 Tax=Smallanthus sonchifolius TaxID=185202 RepID=A0ACB9E9J5_9ASTR|nr:hypothetical protein L1987_54921 [Smallanthus sonchifolius]